MSRVTQAVPRDPGQCANHDAAVPGVGRAKRGLQGPDDDTQAGCRARGGRLRRGTAFVTLVAPDVPSAVRAAAVPGVGRRAA